MWFLEQISRLILLWESVWQFCGVILLWAQILDQISNNEQNNTFTIETKYLAAGASVDTVLINTVIKPFRGFIRGIIWKAWQGGRSPSHSSTNHCSIPLITHMYSAQCFLTLKPFSSRAVYSSSRRLIDGGWLCSHLTCLLLPLECGAGDTSH